MSLKVQNYRDICSFSIAWHRPPGAMVNEQICVSDCNEAICKHNSSLMNNPSLI